jgi:DNA-binding transcriptional MerR regulator
VSVATIKYYLREGLLPAGARRTRKLAEYTDRHLHRLRLIRVLREVGGLSIDTIRDVVLAIDDPDLPLHSVLGVAHRALSPAPPGDEGRPELDDVGDLLDHLGWEVSPEAPARRELARALAGLRALRRDVDATTFLPYAEAAEALAADEVASLSAGGPRDLIVEQVVVGSVVYGTALAALRRLAQEHQSGQHRGRDGR